MVDRPGVKTIEWIDGRVTIIDQTRLPEEHVTLPFEDYYPLIEALKTLRIRGAPAIGIAAAFGVALSMNASTAAKYDEFKKEFETISSELSIGTPLLVSVESVLVNFATATFFKRIPNTGKLSFILSKLYRPFSVFTYRLPTNQIRIMNPIPT